MTRKEIINKRKNLDAGFVTEASNFIISSVYDIVMESECTHFLCYYPTCNEPDIRFIYEELLAQGKKLYFPKTTGDTMEFYGIHNLNDFKVGQFGIYEPTDLSDDNMFTETTSVFVFTPGVMFSTKCDRCGFGRGYYDKYLSRLTDSLFVGIAYEFQVFPEIEVNEWDIPLNYVITEKHKYTCEETICQ